MADAVFALIILAGLVGAGLIVARTVIGQLHIVLPDMWITSVYEVGATVSWITVLVWVSARIVHRGYTMAQWFRARIEGGE